MTRVLWDGAIFARDSGGGIARYFSELAGWFSDNAEEERISLLVPASTPYPVRNALPIRPVIRGVYARPASWRFLRPQIFHTTYYTTRPDLKCPQVVTVYDFVDARFPACAPNGPGFAARQAKVLQQAEAIVAISESTKGDAVYYAGVSADAITVAYPSVSSAFRLGPATPAECDTFTREVTGGYPFFLHVGERGGYKNFTRLLEAFSILARREEIYLLLCGGEKKLSPVDERLIIDAGVGHRIIPLGRLSDARLRVAYGAARALTHASLAEGFGIPLIECLASGGSLVLSDIPVYREVAGHLAIYADPASTEAWVEALRMALVDPVPCSDAQRAALMARFDRYVTGQTHRTLYRSLLSS